MGKVEEGRKEREGGREDGREEGRRRGREGEERNLILYISKILSHLYVLDCSK